jgi:hypothetical protein
MWMKTSLIALGMASAFAVATPVATLAQGVYIGPGGVGVDVGPPRYRERGYYREDDYYRDDYTYERPYRGRGCRTVTIRRDNGSVKQIRRCD